MDMHGKEIKIRHCLLSLGVSGCIVAFIVWIISFSPRSDYSLIEKVAVGLGGYVGAVLALFIISCFGFFIARIFTSENILCLQIAIFALCGLAVISVRVVLSAAHASQLVINIMSAGTCLVGYFVAHGFLSKLIKGDEKFSRQNTR